MCNTISMRYTLSHAPAFTYPKRLWFATVLTIAFFAVILLGCAGMQLAGDVPSTSNPSVAKLVKVVDGETSGYCTVFKVGTELAMTAGHCCGLDEEDLLVNPKATLSYHAVEGRAIPGAGFEVLVDDDEHDVCVMKGKMEGPALQLAPHDPLIGSRVWTAGYPKTVFLISEGLWAGRDGNEGVASIAVWGGASGSPVFDGNGNVIGILRAFYPPMSNMAIIAPVEWLRAGLLTARKK